MLNNYDYIGAAGDNHHLRYGGHTHGAEALGGIGDISYIRASANPPALSANFNVGSDNGEIRIQQALTTPTTLSLYIRALERLGDINRLATLLLTVAAVDPPPLGGGLGQRIGGFLGRRDGRCCIAVGIRRRRRLYLCRRRRLYGGADGLLSLAAGDDAATLTATVTIDDSHDNTVAGERFLDPDDSRGGFICSARCRFLLTTYADSVPFTLHRANLLGRFGDAKLCLGIHGSE